MKHFVMIGYSVIIEDISSNEEKEESEVEDGTGSGPSSQSVAGCGNPRFSRHIENCCKYKEAEYCK